MYTRPPMTQVPSTPPQHTSFPWSGDGDEIDWLTVLGGEEMRTKPSDLQGTKSYWC